MESNGLANGSEIAQTFLTLLRESNRDCHQCGESYFISLWEEALGNENKKEAGNLYNQWKISRLKNMDMDENVKILLTELKKRYPLALITNGFSDHQWGKIKGLNLEKYFDCILVSEDEKCEKPDENIFIKACEKLKVNANSCVMIGDNLETDMLGAKRANFALKILFTAYKDCNVETHNQMQIVDTVISSVEQLIAELNKLLN